MFQNKLPKQFSIKRFTVFEQKLITETMHPKPDTRIH